ncbi:hypothetical protein KI387_038470 [Taxus chinensis]|uniref:Reverse transcriptase domain-containing protein n=1 Tax=Taxus chinensis TaxID=29808 RepID=A0AA38FAU6_TAXCH|nr:hypothetical protein KI387_038470 [Taxus chinensis]
MLFQDAGACITINGQQSEWFSLHRSIRQGCPLAPSLYVIAAEGLSYLLANAAHAGLVQGIQLPSSPQQLINGHFADDSFLTLAESEASVSNAMQCLDTFCLASGSAIQWKKTQCYRQAVGPKPPWLEGFQWLWIEPGIQFKFLGIPFAFMASPADLWDYVIQRVEKKISFWLTKHLSLAGKFQVCSKVLAATHVYYSSCWAPSKAAYHRLEKILREFLWANSEGNHGFHRVAWDVCCTPKNTGGLGLINIQLQGVALTTKWIIRSLEGEESWKILLRHCISQGSPLNRKAWQGLNYYSLLLCPVPIKIGGSFVAKSIWKAWELLKPHLLWQGDGFRNGLSLNSLSLWWNPVFQYQDKPLALSVQFKGMRLFRKGVKFIQDLFCPATRDWLPWISLKAKFSLHDNDKQAIFLIQELIPGDYLHKIGVHTQRPWWFDWHWPAATPFRNYKPRVGYKLLAQKQLPFNKLNARWSLHSTRFGWKQRFQVVWAIPIEPKVAHFLWCILHQGLPVGKCLILMGAPPLRCPFCNHIETLLHLFWFCPHAQSAWRWIHTLFQPFLPTFFTWKMVLLGDSAFVPAKFYNIWHSFRATILYHIWKTRNSAIFNKETVDRTFVISNKLVVISNVSLQIQVQAEKVRIEVEHLQTLLDHWGSNPCTVSRVPPNSPHRRSRSQGRRSRSRGRHNFDRGLARGRRSTSPHRRGPSPPPSWAPPAPGVFGQLGGGSSGWQAPDHSKFPRLSLAISPNQRGNEEEQPQTDGWEPITDTPANPPGGWGDRPKSPPQSPPASMFATAA